MPVVETATWDDVPDWDENGPLDGGADSVDGLPIRGLRNRTAWLRKAKAARVYRSTQQSINLGADTPVVFDTVQYDYLGAWDSLNNRFKPTMPGLYKVKGGIHWSVLAANGSGYALFVEAGKNGQTVRSGSAAGIRGTTIPVANTITGDFGADTVLGDTLYFDGVNDYIKLYAMVTGGSGAMNIGNASAGRALLWFSIEYLGNIV